MDEDERFDDEEELDKKFSDEEDDESDDDSDSKKKDEESEDDESDSKDDDEESNDKGEDEEVEKNKTIALQKERDRRKKVENDFIQYKKDHPDNTEQKPKVKVTKDTPLSDTFWQGTATTHLNSILIEDPAAKHFAGEVKKILFEERPELQKEGLNGVKLAFDIAKGRATKSSSEDSHQDPLKPKTSKPLPGNKGTEVKKLTQSEYNKLNSSQQAEYEEQQMRSRLVK